MLGAVGVAVATIGPGEWSLDEALGIDLNGATGLAIQPGRGVAMAATVLGTSYRPPAPAPRRPPTPPDHPRGRFTAPGGGYVHTAHGDRGEALGGQRRRHPGRRRSPAAR